MGVNSFTDEEKRLANNLFVPNNNQNALFSDEDMRLANNLFSNNSEINEETKGNGFFGWAKDGFDAGFAGVPAGQVNFLDANLGLGKDTASYLDNVVKRNSKTKNVKVELTNPEYYKDPQGATYDLFNAAGSMTSLGLETLAMLFGGEAVGGVGVAANVLSKIPGGARAVEAGKALWDTTAGKFAVGNVVSKVPESISNAGNIVEEMRAEGKSEEEIRTAVNKDAGMNMLLNIPMGALESTGLMKLGKGGNALNRVLGGAAGGAGTNYIEEGAQAAIDDIAQGKPIDWDEVNNNAKVGLLTGGTLGGMVGGMKGADSTPTNLNAQQAEAWGEAQWVSEQTGVPAEFVYRQWAHESGNFTSQLARENNNFGGLTQVEANGEENKQPDGGNYYKQYSNMHEYAQDYINSFLRHYDGVGNVKSIEEFAQVLKDNGYYGDSIENYINGLKGIEAPTGNGVRKDYSNSSGESNSDFGAAELAQQEKELLNQIVNEKIEIAAQNKNMDDWSFLTDNKHNTDAILEKYPDIAEQLGILNDNDLSAAKEYLRNIVNSNDPNMDAAYAALTGQTDIYDTAVNLGFKSKQGNVTGKTVQDETLHHSDLLDAMNARDYESLNNALKNGDVSVKSSGNKYNFIAKTSAGESIIQKMEAARKKTEGKRAKAKGNMSTFEKYMNLARQHNITFDAKTEKLGRDGDAAALSKALKILKKNGVNVRKTFLDDVIKASAQPSLKQDGMMNNLQPTQQNSIMDRAIAYYDRTSNPAEKRLLEYLVDHNDTEGLKLAFPSLADEQAGVKQFNPPHTDPIMEPGRKENIAGITNVLNGVAAQKFDNAEVELGDVSQKKIPYQAANPETQQRLNEIVGTKPPQIINPFTSNPEAMQSVQDLKPKIPVSGVLKTADEKVMENAFYSAVNRGDFGKAIEIANEMGNTDIANILGNRAKFSMRDRHNKDGKQMRDLEKEANEYIPENFDGSMPGYAHTISQQQVKDIHDTVNRLLSQGTSPETIYNKIKTQYNKIKANKSNGLSDNEKLRMLTGIKGVLYHVKDAIRNRIPEWQHGGRSELLYGDVGRKDTGARGGGMALDGQGRTSSTGFNESKINNQHSDNQGAFFTPGDKIKFSMNDRHERDRERMRAMEKAAKHFVPEGYKGTASGVVEGLAEHEVQSVKRFMESELSIGHSMEDIEKYFRIAYNKVKANKSDGMNTDKKIEHMRFLQGAIGYVREQGKSDRQLSSPDAHINESNKQERNERSVQGDNRSGYERSRLSSNDSKINQDKHSENQGAFSMPEITATKDGVKFSLAYHGSPHQFGKFDLGAIGTGEGNQVHGWGLYFSADKKVAENYRDKLSRKNPSEKQLYAVDIPKDAVMLNEDNPLNEQPQAVKQAIYEYMKQNEDSYITPNSIDDLGNQAGKQFYKEVVFNMKRVGESNPKKAASEKLNQLGIKGIIYDGYQDGRCYVVFDDKAIDIIAKYSKRDLSQKTSTPDSKNNSSDYKESLTDSRQPTDEEIVQMVKLTTGTKIVMVPKDAKILPRLQRIADFGAKMGCPIRYYDAKPYLHGFHASETSYINRDSEMPHYKVFWHESFHWLKNNNEKLYQDMVEHLKKTNAFSREKINAYRKGTGRTDLTNEGVIEEMMADAMMDVAKRVGLTKQLAKDNSSLAERFIAWIHDTMKKFHDFFADPKYGLTPKETKAMADGFTRFMRDAVDGNGKKMFLIDAKNKITLRRNGEDINSVLQKDLVPAYSSKDIQKPWQEGVEEKTLNNIMQVRNELKDYLAQHGETIHIDTPERQALRNKIANELYGSGAKNKNNEIYIVLGPPAAGKSSVADPLAKKTGSMIIDSDMAKERLPEFNNGKLAGAVHEESDFIMQQVLEQAMVERDNIILPVVGRTYDGLVKKVRKFKDNGYKVHIIHVDLPINKAAQRAVTRFEETGRFVDPNYVSSIGYSTRENYDKIKNIEGVDSYEAYSNDVPRGGRPIHLESVQKIRGERRKALYGNNGESQTSKGTKTEEPKLNHSDKQGGFSMPENKPKYSGIDIKNNMQDNIGKGLRDSDKDVIFSSIMEQTKKEIVHMRQIFKDDNKVRKLLNEENPVAREHVVKQFAQLYNKFHSPKVNKRGLLEYYFGKDLFHKKTNEEIAQKFNELQDRAKEMLDYAKFVYKQTTAMAGNRRRSVGLYTDYGSWRELERDWETVKGASGTGRSASGSNESVTTDNHSVKGGFSMPENKPKFSMRNDSDSPVTRKEIQSAVNQLVTARTGGIKDKNVLGKFNSQTNIVRTKFYGDFPTLAHEIGHYIDSQLKISGHTLELVQYAKERFPNGEYKASELRGEGIAEFGRLLLTKPALVEKEFPNYYKAYQEAITNRPDLARPIEIIGQKIRRWYAQSPEARGSGSIVSGKGDSFKDKLKTMKDDLYVKFVDKLDPLYRLNAALEKELGKKLAYEDNIYQRARMIDSFTRGRSEMLILGKDPVETIDALNKTLRGVKLKNKVTLHSIFDKIEEKAMQQKYPDYLKKGNFANWQRAFSVYLTARRQKELQTVMPGYHGPFSKADTDAIIQNAPAELREAAIMYYKYNENLLLIAEDAGIISKATLEALNKKYKNYAPMLRDFSDEAAMDNFFGGLGGGGLGNVSTFLKKNSDTGSDRSVIDPLEVTVKNTYSIIDRAERNKVARLFVKFSKENNLGEYIEKVDKKTSDSKRSIFTVMVAGEKEAYQTIPELYGAIIGCTEDSAGVVGSLFKTTAQTLRTGATISPDFIVRNLIRDTIFAGISSKTGFVPILDTIRGMRALKLSHELAAEFKAAGVPMSNFVGTSRRGAADTLDAMAGGDKGWRSLTPVKILKGIYESAQNASELIESSSRMGEFMRAREQGISVEEAGFMAKELTLDFGRSGTWGQKINQAVPFFNACIQGGDKMFRLLRDDPKRTMAAISKYIILPSLALWALNHDEDWYKELPEDVKNGSWVWKTGDTIVKLPKPQEAGVLFGSSLERVLDAVYDKNPKAMKEWAIHMRDVVTPNIMPTLVLPIIEWATNYSFFTGKALVGRKEQNLPNGMQYNLYTSELSKRIGSAVGLSPIKIDNMIRGYTGTAGMFVVQSMDNIFGKPYEMPEKKWSELPGIRGFTHTAYKRAKSVDEFYEIFDTLSKEHNASGNVGHPSAAVRGVRKTAQQISNMQQIIRKATVNPNLSPVQKRTIIDEKNKQILAIAKKGKETYGKLANK